MSELLTAVIDRLEVMRSDADLFVHALAGAVMLAATEDARAKAAINYDDIATLEVQRRTEDEKVALQLAWRETRHLSATLGERIDVFRELEDRLAQAT